MMNKTILCPCKPNCPERFNACKLECKKYSMYELKIVRDYKEGKVTKEQLDKCSTCDMCATINDGLSAASKEQLVGKTGEEIVDADIAKQMEIK